MPIAQMAGNELFDEALALLRKALDNPGAAFREGQWECIERLLQRKRILVVQRTGWGKSMVYFLATRLLRARGAGPTLLISPLISLMRNQRDAARRIGVNAIFINSENREEWEGLRDDILSDRVDIILISPERLANGYFRMEVLAPIAERIGLFAVDEAHCISDWGHDFRPDYKRIVRVLRGLPPNVPVLATTATANNRVVRDIKGQLGEGLAILRGTLVRKSLRLQNIAMPDKCDRLAWLAKTIPTLPGSGIVYTLTVRDSEQVAAWLKRNGIEAEAYHAEKKRDAGGSPGRERLEEMLLENRVKALVATVALGMGFDKPDLGFVIHFQRPASVVHYYQQVGRAGRAVDMAYGILLCGEEDDDISDYFIRQAFPPQKNISAVLGALEKSEEGLSVFGIGRELNLSIGEIEKTLTFLSTEYPAPILKDRSRWKATAAALNYRIDQGKVDAITALRHAEQEQMREYMRTRGCLMAFLQNALDDPSGTPCGQCANCSPGLLPDPSCDPGLVNRAGIFLRRNHQPVEPRLQWPAGFCSGVHPAFRGRLPPGLRAEEGRALCRWLDGGWGREVREGKYRDGRFSDNLVAACVEMVRAWRPDPFPEWAACIPSLRHPGLVPDFAARLARALGIDFAPLLQKARENEPQKSMQNSYQQMKNLDGAFRLDGPCRAAPCLLIDDMVDSGWTFTYGAALLREAGCRAVFPLALATTSNG